MIFSRLNKLIRQQVLPREQVVAVVAAWAATSCSPTLSLLPSRSDAEDSLRSTKAHSRNFDCRCWMMASRANARATRPGTAWNPWGSLASRPRVARCSAPLACPGGIRRFRRRSQTAQRTCLR